MLTELWDNLGIRNIVPTLASALLVDAVVDNDVMTMTMMYSDFDEPLLHCAMLVHYAPTKKGE